MLCSAFISLRNRVAILADRKRRGNIKAQRILPSCGSQAKPPGLDAMISPFRNNTVHALRGQKNCSRAINAVRKKTRIRVGSCTAAVLSEYCSPPRSRSGVRQDPHMNDDIAELFFLRVFFRLCNCVESLVRLFFDERSVFFCTRRHFEYNFCFLNTLQLFEVIIPEKCESFNHSNQ